MADIFTILAALSAGLLLGIFAGLVPGIHSNTIASVLAASGIDANILSFLIVAAFAAHVVVEFFPSVFLGIPDQNTVLSVLPGHRLALEGRGIEALRICALSALAAAAGAALLFPLSLVLFPLAYGIIKPFILPILVGACGFLILGEGNAKAIAGAAFVFLLSGALGSLTLNAEIREPLFPIFTGMFALSGIFAASEFGGKLKRQADAQVKVDFKKHIALGVLLGMFADLLPGLGAPAQMAAFATLAVPLEDGRKYLALTASIAASHAVFAFSSLLAIGKARVGALATLAQVADVGAEQAYVYIAAFLLALALASLALLFLAKHARSLLAIDSQKLNALIAIYLVAAVFLLSGPLGLLVLAASTAIGSLPIFLNVRRSHVLGAILVPAMLGAAGFLR